MVGGCLANSWLAWQARGVDSWVVEALRVGYRIPFDRPPPLSECPVSLPAYSPHSIRGVALNQELQNLLRKGAVEPAPQSPGFYSRLFLVKKALGSWRPIIDLSTLNHYVTSSRFHMETPRSVLNSIRPGDWMISLDLQDAYLQVPVHHDSRRFLRFVLDGKPFQFRVLCFGLTTAPQVFTRIMAPVSAILHKYGVRMLRYLDDWLILASSEIACLQSRDRLLAVCTELGIQVNLHEVVSDSVSVHSLLGHGDPISALHCSSHTNTGRQPYSSDRGVPVNLFSSSVPLASPPRPPVFPDSSRPRRDDQDETSPTLSQGPVGLSGRPVPGILVPSLQRGSSLVVEAGSAEGGRESLSSSSRHQLLLGRFRRGLGSPSGRASRLGSLAPPSESSLYQHEGASGSSARPSGLRASDRGHVGSAVLRQHHHSSLSSSVGRDFFVHSELHGKRGSSLGGEPTHSSPSPVHHGVVQRHRRRPESPESGDRVRMDPSPGGSGSAGPQVASCDRSFCDRLDSEASGLLFSSLGPTGSRDGRPSPTLGRPSSVRLSSDRHHKESSSQTEVIEELRVDSHSSILASEGLVSRPSGTIIRRSHHTVRSKRSTKTAPLPPVPPKSTYASADCMATLKRFAIQAGFSPAMAGQLIFSRRLSTRLNYQARWGTYRKWCRDFGHRSSSPTIAKVADFLTYMFKTKGAALSTIKGYRAMLAAVFKFPLPEISSSPILKDLIRSFEISAPRPIFPPPPWDLDKVLEFLSGPPFEPLARASFLDKTKKALFLLAMATAKRVSELQALSFSVSFQGEDLVLYYDPFFRAKTESVINPLPRSVVVPSLSDFAGNLPERLHCPVRAIKYLRKAARSSSFIPSRLFVSPKNPKRSMSKNAMSFYLRQLIVDSGAVSSTRPPRAHDIRGIATSLNYYSNLSLTSLMQVATWKSKRVFASRYLKEVSATQDNIQQFGPLVVAGDRLRPKIPQQKHRL